METRVLPSPVFISAIQPKCSAMPPIIWTSKWRWPSTRQADSRTTANASTNRSSRFSPCSRRSLNSTVLCASASSLNACISGSRLPIRGTSSARRRTFLPSPARRTLVNTLMVGRSYRPQGCNSRQPRPNEESGCGRLTWSLTPHSPAARVTHRHRRHGGMPPAQRRPHGTRRLVSARPRQPGTPRAGLTSKPHHAQRPQVALRGSFCLRLASTFNHRPARSPVRY